MLIYIREIDKNLHITEELLSMESLQRTTTGKDLYNCSVMSCLIRSELNLNKLVSITTDGAPALLGKNSGLVRLMKDKVREDFPLHNELSFSLHHTSRKPL